MLFFQIFRKISGFSSASSFKTSVFPSRMKPLLPLIGCGAAGLFAIASCTGDEDDLSDTVRRIEQRLETIEKSLHEKSTYEKNLDHLQNYVDRHKDVLPLSSSLPSPEYSSDRLSSFHEWSRYCLNAMTDVVCGVN